MSKSLDILVVDDDRDNADSLAELFEMEGHRVRVAYSGEGAIAAYREGNYHLAFMDVMMPDRNGVESFLEIRRMRPDAKVYMMTGFSVEQLLQQALDNGALGIMSKPVDLEAVLRTIDTVRPSGMVLVAEDDPEFGPELQNLIENAGLGCELVTNGRDALERMARGGIDTLILDLNMPLINGIDVYKQLKSVNAPVPTIVITGCRDANADALDAMRDIEFSGILTKPFDPSVLLSKLERLAG